MEEKCKSCSIDDVGCGVIKQLRKEVLKIKVHRSYLHIIALFICVLGLFVAGLFAFRTFCPAPSAKNVVYNIKISGEKNISGDVKAEIKKELAEALIEVENRAVSSYNEKFTILLTVLTIFGIAWPLVVAMLQLRFNEGELKKIKEAEEKANAANTSVGQFDEKISSFENRMNNLFEAQLNMQNTTQKLEALKHNFYEELQTISGGLGVAYVLIDETKTNGNDALIKIAFKMLFLQIKYACKSGTGIDSAIDLIVSLCENLKIKKQVQLKDFILDEDWASLEVECITEEQKAKITQLRQDLLSSENGGNK